MLTDYQNAGPFRKGSDQPLLPSTWYPAVTARELLALSNLVLLLRVTPLHLKYNKATIISQATSTIGYLEFRLSHGQFWRQSSLLALVKFHRPWYY